ncbi:MAG: hypothetical protein AB7N99_08735 [Simkaniaceae bacterium]
MAITEDFSSIVFLDFFTELEGPRLERHKLYPLNEILLPMCKNM